ncbi:MAG TPA: hypothetical protein VGE76_07445 [Opitutaceae bacterium]
MEKPWKVIAAFVGVFVAGAVFGGLFSARAARRPVVVNPPPQQPQGIVVPFLPGEHKKGVANAPLPGQGPVTGPRGNQITPELMRKFTRSLKLTPAQKEKILPIVGRAGEDFQRLRDEDIRRRQEDNRRRQEHLEDVARVNERMYVDVSNALLPEQKEKLQQIRQEIENKVEVDRKKREQDAADLSAARAAIKADRERLEKEKLAPVQPEK